MEEPTPSRYSRLKKYVATGILAASAAAIGLLAGARHSESVNHAADHIAQYQVKLSETIEENSPEFVSSCVRYLAGLRSGGKSPEELDQEAETFKQDLEKRLQAHHQ